MNNSEIEKLIKQAIIDYHIDSSIQATRIVGNKLELYLLGGQILRIPIPAPPARGPANTTPPPPTGKNRNGSLKSTIKKTTRRGG